MKRPWSDDPTARLFDATVAAQRLRKTMLDALKFAEERLAVLHDAEENTALDTECLETVRAAIKKAEAL